MESLIAYKFNNNFYFRNEDWALGYGCAEF